MKYDKEDIIKEYFKLKEYLGHSPSSTEFYRETKINRKSLEKCYGSNSYSKLVVECGDTPNKFTLRKSDFETILIQWGELTRKLGKMPTKADWEYADCKPTAESVIRSNKIKWSEMPDKFSEYASSKSEWKSVLDLIPKNTSVSLMVQKVNTKRDLPYEIYKYIPPILHDLNDLSTNEESSREFEKKVNLLFRLLGFEVNELGQGSG